MNRRDALGFLGTFAGSSALAGAARGEPPDHDGPDKDPSSAFHLYLCAFHVTKQNPNFVVEAHHYCSPVAEDVHQCIIYDRRGKGAKLLGIEYIISDAIYRKLPQEEKKYYHPHAYEITSGQLILPNEADQGDKALAGLIRTWGKTWHTWPDPKTDLPMGEPVLMWSANRDGQIPDSAIAARDKQFMINTSEIRKRRAHLGPVPNIDPPKSLEDLGRQFTNDGPDEPPKR